MIVDVSYWTRILKNVTVFIISLIIIYFAFKLAIFYMPFLIGFIISLLVEPLIKILTKKSRLERKKCAIIVLIVIFSLILGLITWGIVTILTESSNLMQGLNNYIQLFYNKIKEYMQIIKTGNSKIPAEIITIIENSTDKIILFITNFTTNFLGKLIRCYFFIANNWNIYIYNLNCNIFYLYR